MNHPPSEVLLTAEDLTVSSGSTTLLNKVSFSLFRGKTLGVIGPSGSGKTMIANVLMQLLPAGLVARANNLHFLNESTKIDLLTPQKGLRGKVVAMVFQDSYAALNPVLTVGQQLIETILLHQNLSAAEALAAARVWLQKVNLTEHAVILQSYPHQLSGGQRQRIMIALALVGNPSIVIADEPTSSLDRQNQALIVSLLQSLQAELQFALVFISHDEQLVETIADDQLRLAAEVQSSRVQPQVVDEVAELPSTRMLVALTDVSFSYPHTPGLVLDKVNLEVYEKQTVGIVGASGSGKSTIAKLLMGLETTNSGNISYAKMNVDLAHFRQIVFQDATTALNPRLKIQSCLADLSTEPTTIQAMLEAVGLPLSVLQKYPNQLSGGQKQRVAIARSLLLRPQLLICDEIVSALDLSTQNRIIELLQQLKIKQQMSYLFISHDLELVRNFCDTAYELVEGTCRKLF